MLFLRASVLSYGKQVDAEVQYTAATAHSPMYRADISFLSFIYHDGPWHSCARPLTDPMSVGSKHDVYRRRTWGPSATRMMSVRRAHYSSRLSPVREFQTTESKQSWQVRHARRKQCPITVISSDVWQQMSIDSMGRIKKLRTHRFFT